MSIEIAQKHNTIIEPILPLQVNRHTRVFDLAAKTQLLAGISAQCERLARHRGTQFTLMVTGESGTGKSTFIRSLFGNEFTSSDNHTTEVCKNPLDHYGLDKSAKRTDIHRTAEIEVHQVELDEFGFETKLTVVDTPGYGDYTNNTNTWVPISNYIDSQNLHYALQEEQPYRKGLEDNRVNLCLYFLAPTNRVLELDITAMKALSSRVNLIPIIGKADSMTPHDLAKFKQTIRSTLQIHGISVWTPNVDQYSLVDFGFPQYEWPFAVVTSDELVQSKTGQLVRGREYRWGTVEIDNPAHSDFPLLKELLIGKFMLNLLDDTHYQFYLPYRRTLRLHRLETALNLNSEDGSNAAQISFGTKERKDGEQNQDDNESDSAAGLSPVERALQSMTSLEVISVISEVGAKYLRTEQLSNDPVLQQRATGLKSQFDIVAKYQQERFAAQALELQQLRDGMEREIKRLSAENARIEDDIKLMESDVKRRK